MDYIMGEHKIKTFAEIQKIWVREYDRAVRLDVLFIKKAWLCIDGIAVLMSPDITYYMTQNMYEIRREDFEQWSEDDKEYFKERFSL